MSNVKHLMPDGEVVSAPALPQFKTPYNHDTKLVSDLTATFCPEESLTKQEFKDDADINNIINRFLRAGEPPPVTLPEHFTDTTTRRTWFDTQVQLAEVNGMFYELPARIRTEFANDPAQWADEAMARLQRRDDVGLAKMGIQIQFQQPQDGDPGSGATTPAPKPNAAPAAPGAATPPGAPKSDPPK